MDAHGGEGRVGFGHLGEAGGCARPASPLKAGHSSCWKSTGIWDVSVPGKSPPPPAAWEMLRCANKNVKYSIPSGVFIVHSDYSALAFIRGQVLCYCRQTRLDLRVRRDIAMGLLSLKAAMTTCN